MKDLLATSDPNVLALTKVPQWPSLGLSGVAPLGDADSLLYLAMRVESSELDPHERQVISYYLRAVAASREALRALRPRSKGRPGGRSRDIALHYAVQCRVASSAAEAANTVAKFWGVSAKSVQDNKHVPEAHGEVEDVIEMRLAGPSWHRNPDGSFEGPKDWTERTILEAMDRDLRARRD
jgi:hypothetical protein